MDEQQELEQLERQQAELQKQMQEMMDKMKKRQEELQAKIQLEKKKLEAKQPVNITVTGFSAPWVYLKVDPYREDVINVFRVTPQRMYNNGLNTIPVSELSNLREKCEALQGVKFKINQEYADQIHKFLFAPAFAISVDHNYLWVEPHPSASTYQLRNIPGSDYDYRKQRYKFPLAEAWRIWELFANTSTLEMMANGMPPVVTWTDDAQALAEEQVTRRAKLDKIALAEDWPIEIPTLKATLKNYQNVGVAFFQHNGGSGILADDMGLGKTMQAIALNLLQDGMAIIVTPASLKINWIREIGKFTDEKAHTLSGSTPTAFEVAYLIKNRPKFLIINYDILATNTEFVTEYTDAEGFKHHKKETRFPWVEVLNLLDAELIVYDEAHYIKNIDSARSQATRKLVGKRIICMTGTPVVNRPHELWPMLHIVDPQTFPQFEPFVRQYTYDGKNVRNVAELRQLLKPIMIRRLKKDVIKDIVPPNRINQYHELSAKAKKLYQRVLDGVYEVVSEWDPNNAGDQRQVHHILVQIQRLKQVCAIDKVAATADLATSIYDSSDPEDRPKKVLIFSQFKATAYGIKVRLGDEAIGFVSRRNGEFITADNSEQDRLVQEFQTNPNVHYLVVTEKTAKEGHNITQAMAVIFNDLFWTPAGHQQAEGRCYMRTGDMHNIDSYYMIAEATIDDWIMQLLAAKLNIIEQVVEGVNTIRNADESIFKELLDKMRNGQWKK